MLLLGLACIDEILVDFSSHHQATLSFGFAGYVKKKTKLISVLTLDNKRLCLNLARQGFPTSSHGCVDLFLSLRASFYTNRSKFRRLAANYN